MQAVGHGRQRALASAVRDSLQVNALGLRGQQTTPGQSIRQYCALGATPDGSTSRVQSSSFSRQHRRSIATSIISRHPRPQPECHNSIAAIPPIRLTQASHCRARRDGIQLGGHNGQQWRSYSLEAIAPEANKEAQPELEPSSRVDGPSPSSRINEQDQHRKTYKLKRRKNTSDNLEELNKVIDILSGGQSRFEKGAHFKKYGRPAQMSKFEHERQNVLNAQQREQSRGPKVTWEDVYRTLKINTRSLSLDHESVRIKGSARRLSELQKSLQDSDLQCRSIVRFGETFTMIVVGPRAALDAFRENIQTSLSEVKNDAQGQLEVASITPAGQADSENDARAQNDKLTRSARQHFELRVIDATQNVRKWNVPQAITILKELFAESRSSEAKVSFKAYRTTLRFLLNHGEVPAAQDLLSRAHQYEIVLSTPVFNIFLRECIRRSNMRAFYSVVNSMVMEGVPINGSTWLAFHDIVPSSDAKSYVLREMLRLGFSKYDNAAHHVAEPVIKHGLPNHLDRGRSLPTYLATLNRAFGSQWPSPRAVKTLIGLLVSRNMSYEAIDCLKVIEAQFGFRPNPHILDVIVMHYATQRDMAKAVESVKTIGDRWPTLRPLKIAYDRMWHLAMKTRHINVAKVVWKYACMEGHTKSIREEVQQSLEGGLKSILSSDAKTAVLSISQKFDRVVGLLVVGGASEMVTLNQQASVSHDEAEKKAEELAQAIVEADVSMEGRFDAEIPFAEAVSKALVMDRNWSLTGLRKQIIDDFRLDIPTIDVVLGPTGAYTRLKPQEASMAGRKKAPGIVRKVFTSE